LNYARRQQCRRLSRAGKAALGSAAAMLLGIAVASAGAAALAAVLAAVLLLTAVGLGLDARHWLLLARRSQLGARSEDEVQRALAPLQAEGWRLRHSLAWRGPGDIDSVTIAPSGIAVAMITQIGQNEPCAPLAAHIAMHITHRPRAPPPSWARRRRRRTLRAARA